VRRAAETLEDAKAECALLSEQSVPSDGVVAVSRTSMVQYKIKDVCTIDLLHKGGSLTLSDSDLAILWVDEQLAEDVIYEVQVMPSPTEDNGGGWILGYDNAYYRVTKIREDKSAPNPLSALENILEIIGGDVHSVEMRRMTAFSFLVREYMWKSVHRSISDFKVVVDCGTDRGQSLKHVIANTMLGTEDTPPTLILCDPRMDVIMINKARRIVSEQCLNTRVQQCLPGDLPKLNTLPGYILVCKCGLNTVLESINQDKVKCSEVCVVCTFSLQYVYDVLCSFDCMWSYIGCCYVYDDIEEGQSSVTYKDVAMWVSNGVGHTKWGRDEFIEPHILSYTPARGNMMNAKDMVPYHHVKDDEIIL
jgi:hypothetical protein